ncbi:hypothetical protein [Mixta hanseatica]|uniref:Bacteriocin n=1 Tax=Mixta hanseatica TaxID=2872648 RepID=A0ABY4R6Y5_9GAMM|nr:hypothetical protein [Mixta hanseatica]UQY43202.1 hypothetical protein K6958_15080 [Mixta hanseatica]
MKYLNREQIKQISGAGQADGYWENDNWNDNEHSDWANKWHEAGRDAWNKRGNRDYPWRRS